MCQCAGRDGDMRRCARATARKRGALMRDAARSRDEPECRGWPRASRPARRAAIGCERFGDVRGRRAHFGRVGVRALELGAHARLVVVRVVGVGVYLRARGGERAQPRERAWSGGDAPVNLTGGGAGSRHARALVISTTAHAASRAASCSATAPSARAAARLAALSARRHRFPRARTAAPAAARCSRAPRRVPRVRRRARVRARRAVHTHGAVAPPRSCQQMAPDGGTPLSGAKPSAA